jgi:F0F1-type ATP synthase membrane subunit b/b'
MFDFNLTFLLVLLSFGVFVALMRSFFFEPLRQLQGKREDQLAQDKRETDRLVGSFFTIEAEVKAATADMHHQSLALIADARQEAKKLAAQRLEATRQEAIQSMAQGRDALEQSCRQASEPLVNQATELAGELAKRLLTNEGAALV